MYTDIQRERETQRDRDTEVRDTEDQVLSKTSVGAEPLRFLKKLFRDFDSKMAPNRNRLNRFSSSVQDRCVGRRNTYKMGAAPTSLGCLSEFGPHLLGCSGCAMHRFSWEGIEKTADFFTPCRQGASLTRFALHVNGNTHAKQLKILEPPSSYVIATTGG